jgi:hypothetical protein
VLIMVTAPAGQDALALIDAVDYEEPKPLCVIAENVQTFPPCGEGELEVLPRTTN